jgi:hypothetical protein
MDDVPAFRPRPIFTPPPLETKFEWRPVFENWSRKWVHDHFWRVRAEFQTEEDALQECALIWSRCVKAYAAKIHEPKHLMALFKTAVARDWHSAATKDSARRDHLAVAQQAVLSAPQVAQSGGPAVVALRQGSVDLRQFFHELEVAPRHFLAMLFSDDKGISIRARRLLGLTPGCDVIAELRSLL